jgi:OOP family OmpA-OmpF porin
MEKAMSHIGCDTTKHRILFAALVCAAIGLAAAPVFAQGVAPSEETITQALRPSPLGVSQGLPTAAASMRTEATATGSLMAAFPVETPAPAAIEHPSVSLDTILFEFDSAQLRPESITTLRNLGAALSNGLRDQRAFVIEGHTDIVGDSQYNVDLSRRRAEAVKDYLVHEVGVDADRLQTVGKGSADLANPRDPRGAENRRVVVINSSV